MGSDIPVGWPEGPDMNEDGTVLPEHVTDEGIPLGEDASPEASS
jgi:hypothetical protein